MCSMRPSSSRATSISGSAPRSRLRSSSRWPRAIVTGVRSSWEASWRNCFSRSSNRAFVWDTRCTSSSAAARRRACQTMARNIADMSGTSASSPGRSVPDIASARIEAPVVTITRPSTNEVCLRFHTRNPYSDVRLTQMKWNGIVSPSRPQDHGGEVRRGEQRPTRLESVRPRPTGSPHGAPFRWGLQGRASCAGAARTRRPHSSQGRSGSPTPPRGGALGSPPRPRGQQGG